ncbi:MAG: Ig-like domain-containing protein [Prolixibacteraceae bacterium]|jgi:N-acetylmuramoyl-L-alanine amidase|nr:N-acetylmuramoyl-L-alanine amidase [Bacteroidota bacterium]NLS99058.1 T9SS type A sorting domain-containing protein [Bacteroidales bacterium]OQB80904.1 MAG: N-acetylmuramoyl-L-alanine amidase [Bacteroidetes bacterium ADurb.Bin123]HNU78168.1 N-acetylmuramoyl-L-alanine amidase [Prolixibacteraceae bacterium]HNZ69215.1 N-acetylmuramoyl-L-alanine amidase [Prolixibacteraceae bacterium]
MKKILRFLILPLFFAPWVLGGQNLSGVKIYVNPGHGGFNSDDRNVPIPPFALGDTAGFWESKSNLVKGLHLRSLLESAGAKVIMSRVQNRTEDDRPLSAIAEEANVNQVDFMISVHSNAFNSVTNYVLMLFHGWDNNPILPQSMELAHLFFDNLFSNQASQWSYSGRQVRGDKTFAPESWDGYGVLRPLTVPGLISEGSFHDYLPETYRLMNREYKHLEAWHLFRAFCQYYGGNPGNRGKIAGTVKDSYRKVTDYPVIPNSKDQWLPVNGARVTLQPGDLVYQVDQLNNGFYCFDNLDPGNYRLTFEADKYTGKVVENIRVDSAAVTYYLCALEQDRSDPMVVEDYGPRDAPEGVSAASAIMFRFNFEVDTTSFREAFSITPSVEGTFVWEDQGRIAKFVPVDPLDVSTEYHVLLRKSVRHIGNLAMEEDFSFSFTTVARNRLTLLNLYPSDGMETVFPFTQVRLHFDGRIKNELLTSRVKIVDSLGNEISRSGVEVNTFSGKVGSYAFLLNNLLPGSSYKLMIDGDLADSEGLTLRDDQFVNFRVAPVFVPEAPVVYDFEATATTWRVDTLNSKNLLPGTANRILRYSGSKLAGSYSYRLLYGFSSPDAHVVVKPPESYFTVKNGAFLGLYLWGDLSENHLSLLFEKDGLVTELPFAEIDFAGWQFREVKAELPDDGEYGFAGFKLESAGTPFSGGGAVYFDNMVKSEGPMTGGRTDVTLPQGQIAIYPNPARELFFVEMEGPLCDSPYRICDMAGRMVREGYARFEGSRAAISVAGLKPGTYVVTLSNCGGTRNGVLMVK